MRQNVREFVMSKTPKFENDEVTSWAS